MKPRRGDAGSWWPRSAPSVAQRRLANALERLQIWKAGDHRFLGWQLVRLRAGCESGAADSNRRGQSWFGLVTVTTLPAGGTANSPDKAFRTIEGAWNAVGGRYAASPLFSINIRLGIPGNYERAYLGAYGGNVAIMGDPNNKSAYRIISSDDGNICFALLLSPSRVDLVGINHRGAGLLQRNAMNRNSCLRTGFCETVWINNCQFTIGTSIWQVPDWLCSPGAVNFFYGVGTFSPEDSNTCKKSGARTGGCAALGRFSWSAVL